MRIDQEVESSVAAEIETADAGLPGTTLSDPERVDDTPANAARADLDQRFSKIAHSERDFPYLLLNVWLEIDGFHKEFGRGQEQRELVLDKMAELLAKRGIPTHTDYSLCPGSENEQRRADEYRADWRRWLGSILRDPEERREVGERAIKIALRESAASTDQSWPPSWASADRAVHTVVGLKLELGVTSVAKDPETVALLKQALTPAVYSGDSYGLYYHFGDALQPTGETRNAACSEAFTRSLADVKVRWYGDSGDRLRRALEFAERNGVEPSTRDTELAADLLSSKWTYRDDTPEKLIAVCKIPEDEVKLSVKAGAEKYLDGMSFEESESPYLYYTRQIQENMRRFGVEPFEVADKAREKLAGMLARQDIELAKEYMRGFGIDQGELLRPPLVDLARDIAVSEFMKTIDYNRRGDPKTPQLDEWRNGALAQVVREAQIQAGADLLAQGKRHQYDLYMKEIGLPPGAGLMESHKPAAVQAAVKALAGADAREAADLAQKFGLDLKSPEFREAAYSGIGKLLDEHREGWWDFDRYREIAKACKLPSAADRDDLREKAAPILEIHLRKGERGALGHAEWLQRAFSFSEKHFTPEISAAANEGVRAAVHDANGPGLRMLKQIHKVPDETFVNAVREEWGQEGGKAQVLAALRHLPPGAVNKLNRDLGLMDYQRDLGVPGPVTYDEYMEIRRSGNRVELAAFVGTIRKEMATLISSEPQDVAALTASPRYRELVTTVFPNHWGQDLTFESVESCPDRSEHLAGLKIKKSYKLTLSEGMELKLKDGQSLDDEALGRLEGSIESAAKRMSDARYETARMRNAVLEEAKVLLGIEGKEPAPAGHHATVLMGALEGSRQPALLGRVKELLISDRLAEMEGARAYVNGTRARAEESKNKEYVYLLELNGFLGDQLRESIQTLVGKALADPAGRKKAEEHYQADQAEQARKAHEQIVNRSQADKLGMADSFLKEAAKRLKQKGGPTPSSEDVLAAISSIEERLIAAGGGEASMEGLEKMRGLVPLVKTQRERTFGLARELGFEPPKDAKLAEIDLSEITTFRDTRARPTPSREKLAAYLTQSLHALVEPDLAILESEIKKFIPKDGEGKAPKTTEVNCYITKNHTSAHARGTASVCVSRDNPDHASNRPGGRAEDCIWNMSGYHQLVLQDAETKVCQGMVLMHTLEDRGKKILTASFNPSSTFLYQVDEKELFNKLLEQVIQFAKDNQIDTVGISTQRYIRTNRTGGEFERAMDESIAKLEKTLNFEKSHTFSHFPHYVQDNTHVVWERPPTLGERLWGGLKSLVGLR